MSFKEVESLDVDTTVSLGGFNKKTKKNNPTKAEGYYLGSKKTDNKKSKNGFSYLHVLQTEKGKIGVWGKTDLDRKLLTVEPGTKVRITQSGTVPTPNGDMYKFKVEADSEDAIEVGALAAQNEADPADAEDSGEYSEEGTDAEAIDEEDVEAYEEAEEETTVSKAAAAATAARQARVQGLLNKGGKAATRTK